MSDSEGAKRLTPQERAEKIDVLLGYVLTPEEKVIIATQIEEAEREAEGVKRQ